MSFAISTAEGWLHWDCKLCGKEVVRQNGEPCIVHVGEDAKLICDDCAQREAPELMTEHCQLFDEWAAHEGINVERVDPDSITVETPADFIRFLDALVRELKSNRATWENNSLEDYLGSILLYLEGWSNELSKVENHQPNWEMLAHLLGRARYDD